MSNFLNDYINHRGADTVLRTIYGILDKKTGEQLVSVQHANLYFSQMEITEIFNKPNQGFVDDGGNTNPDTPNPPVIVISAVNGQPVNGTMNVDGTKQFFITGEFNPVPSNVSFSSFDILADTNVIAPKETVQFFDNVFGAVIPAETLPIGTYKITAKGKLINETTSLESTESTSNEVNINVTYEFKFSVDLPETMNVVSNQDLVLNVDVSWANSQSTYAWYKDDVLQPSYTTKSITIANPLVVANNVWHCVATDKLGRNITSKHCSVTVHEYPSWQTNLTPATMDLTAGDTLSLNVLARGGDSSSYHYYWWFQKASQGYLVTVGTNPSLTIENVNSEDHAGTYHCTCDITVNGETVTLTSDNTVVTVN